MCICTSFGSVPKGAFVTFLRERDSRIGNQSSSGAIAFQFQLRTQFKDMCSTANFIPHGHGTDKKICLMSYPRSGNSFLRALLEKATGYVTGSDSRPNRTLTSNLLRCGFIGEGIVDNSVEIVKSHSPERTGYIPFTSDCIILLVRNPFDSLESYFHMGMTNSHNKSLSDEVLSLYIDKLEFC